MVMKKNGPKTAVAVAAPPKQALRVPSKASPAPAYIPESNEGRAGIKLTEATLPILKLAQPLSPDVKAGRVEVGHYFNSVTKEDYGLEVNIIPCVRVSSRQMLGKYKAGEPMTVLCQAPDGLKALEANGKDGQGKPTDNCGRCVNALWIGDDKPSCNEQGKYLCIIPGSNLPVRLYLQVTGFQAHKAMNTVLIASKYPLYGHKFRLTSVEKGQNRQIIAEPDGFAEEADYHMSKNIYDSMKASFLREKVVVDSTPAAGTEEAF